MLQQLIESGFGNAEDFNCAEKILYGANLVYKLGLDPQALRLSAGFGGGMGIGSTCGAVTASIMVLSSLFVKERAHEGETIKQLSQQFLAAYQREMGDLNCDALKAQHRTPETKCTFVIAKAAEILDQIIEEQRQVSA
ncbi:C-GCAxxG-C-C family (seleno)protein [Azotosporobacter soli]|uniref:C-GCAxxG-C-C family (seleno)protein n=1 Tax=Azotosporobacter soli TaxID=3055040 RepID=UPI0031FF3B99